jgi:hypothetical protein
VAGVAVQVPQVAIWQDLMEVQVAVEIPEDQESNQVKILLALQ